MRTILIILLLATFTSCATWSSLTPEKYTIASRDGNQNKITAKFETDLVIEMITPDTVISKMVKRNIFFRLLKIGKDDVCEFQTITRSNLIVTKNTKFKVLNATEDRFVIEFNSKGKKITIPMIMNKDGAIIESDKNITIITGLKFGDKYIIKESPNFLIKNTFKNTRQNIL